MSRDLLGWLVPLVFALFLVATGVPILTHLRRRGLGRATALLVTVLASLLLLAAVGWLVAVLRG